MVRMVDVAKQAGVSIKTVSRVLNNEPHVQDAMRDKVRQAMDRLGYVPSASAPSLRSRRSYTITLLVHDVRSTFVNAVQFGALRACQDLGFHLQLALVSTETLGSEQALKSFLKASMRDGQPDGLVLVPPMANNPVVAKVMPSLGIPSVRIGPNDEPDTDVSATVKIDDVEASREITNYLIEQGHRRIAFIRGKEDQDATHRRYDGYVDALIAAGIEVDPALVFSGDFDFNSGLAHGGDMLAGDHPPTAVFAANDDMAAGVIMAAHRAGIDVPGELSVAGFDDSEIAVRTWPTLTTIRQPIEQIGVAAIEALVAAAGVSAQPLRSKVLPYELLLRGSTGPRR